jgi:hypothetical protein
VGIIGFGSTEAVILEAQYQLSTQHGIQADFMRVRAIPFTNEVASFIKKYDQVFVVEMNRDGQMSELLKVEYPEFGLKFKSVAFGDGLPASAKWVREGILSKYEGRRMKDEGGKGKAEGRRMKDEGRKVKRPSTKTAKAKTIRAKTTKTAKKKTSAKRR